MMEGLGLRVWVFGSRVQGVRYHSGEGQDKMNNRMEAEVKTRKTLVILWKQHTLRGPELTIMPSLPQLKDMVIPNPPL